VLHVSVAIMQLVCKLVKGRRNCSIMHYASVLNRLSPKFNTLCKDVV